MKKYLFLLFFTFSIMSCAFNTHVSAKEKETQEINITVLKGTDETKDDYPVYELMENDKIFMDIYNKSFIKKSVELYGESLKYSNLENNDIYFAFKSNSGCYGRIGFYLKKDGQLFDKTKSPYIELSNNLLRNHNELSSITQILPHEMGHVLQQITTSKNKDINQISVDMHYSNIITEYSTAFSEGFGEHFEVISRMYEENKKLKNDIYDDIEITKAKTIPFVDRGSRDFILPFRLDYYREISPFWQQKYENIKRNELGVNGDGKYKNITYDFLKPEKSILYRNMGLYQNKTKLRSLEQSLSTEIIISNFFVNLINEDTSEFSTRYSKVFNVFNKYLNKDDRPQLIQFVCGYIKEYPQDKDKVLQIFKGATGHDFTENVAPEIWCISEGTHSNIIFDQFCGMKFPFYIFNLNTCDKEDLLKLDKISKTDAENIISYRDNNNGFKNTDEISNIDNISEKAIETLKNNTSQEYIDKITSSINEEQFQNNFSNIFLANLIHLSLRTLYWFIIFFIIYFLLVNKNKSNILKSAIIKFVKFLFYVLIGFISVIVSCKIIMGGKIINPILIFTIIILIIETLTLLILRKDKLKMKDNIISSFMISSIIIYSLY